jgi:hypothetical protein
MNEKKEPNFDGSQDAYITDWKRARKLIEHQYQLIHQRTTWLLTTNAFLFTAFLILIDNFKVHAILISVAGILISTCLMAAIRAAMGQLTSTEKWWAWRKQSDPRNYPEDGSDEKNLRHPQISECREYGGVLSRNFVTTAVLPSLISATWAALLVAIFVRLWLAITATFLIVLLLFYLTNRKP